MNEKTTKRIEKELLDVFLRYLLNNNPSNFENSRRNNQSNNSAGINPNTKKQILKHSISGIEKIISESFKQAKSSNSSIGNLLVHEFSAERKTDDKSEISIAVSYFRDKKDELNAEITQKSKIKYSIAAENENPWNDSYGVLVHYERKNGLERISISYYEQADNYLAKHIMEKEDMSLRVQLKFLNLLPKSQMGGILGFTYLGDNSMGRRDDLTGNMARMVDIHESIHTSDEYETRVLTDWILEKPKLRYHK